jgi:hypothetical protein
MNNMDDNDENDYPEMDNFLGWRRRIWLKWFRLNWW